MGDYEKLYAQQKLQQIAENAALKALQATGRALPCTVTAIDGALVTVQFDVVAPYTLYPLQLPKAESQWLRAPVQVGDKGMTVSADTLVTTAAGVSSGTPDVQVDYGNLGPTLVWIPIANVDFPTTPDPNKAWLNGPNGAVLSDTAQTVGVTCDHTLQLVTIYAGGNTIVVNADPSIVTTVIGALGNLQTVVDGTANQISHLVPSAAGPIQVLLDGEATALSHIVPVGGVVSVGALAGTLSSLHAGAVHIDLDTLINDASNGVIAKTLQTLSTAIGAAAVTAGAGNPNTSTFASLLSGIMSASGWVKGLSGIKPVIPGCSATVFLKP